MKNSAQKFWLALICLLVPVCLMAQAGVPNVFNPNETEFQHETHFLTFIGSYIPESATSATAITRRSTRLGAKPRSRNGWSTRDSSLMRANGTQAAGRSSATLRAPTEIMSSSQIRM